MSDLKVVNKHQGNHNIYFGTQSFFVVTDYREVDLNDLVMALLRKGWTIKIVQENNVSTLYWGA